MRLDGTLGPGTREQLGCGAKFSLGTEVGRCHKARTSISTGGGRALMRVRRRKRCVCASPQGAAASQPASQPAGRQVVEAAISCAADGGPGARWAPTSAGAGEGPGSSPCPCAATRHANTPRQPASLPPAATTWAAAALHAKERTCALAQTLGEKSGLRGRQCLRAAAAMQCVAPSRKYMPMRLAIDSTNDGPTVAGCHPPPSKWQAPTHRAEAGACGIKTCWRCHRR